MEELSNLDETIAFSNSSNGNGSYHLNGKNTDTSNATSMDMFYFYEVEQFVLLSVLFTAIVIGNISVILVLFYTKTRKSRMNYFIRQLAIADLSVGLINVFTDIIWRITISWYAGNFACKLIRYLQTVVTYASTYVLVALSIDRYDAIKNPMHFRSNWKRAKVLIASAWFLSFLFSSPILLLYEEKQVQDRPQCWIELTEPVQWQIYMCLVVLTVFLLPAVIIVFCYAFILSIIWNKKALVISTKTNQDMIVSSEGIIPKAKIKTVKVTLVIVSVFIVCWSPYMVFDLLQVFGLVPHTQTNIAIASFIQSLAPLNSAANPLIYFIFSQHVFKSLRRCKLFQLITCGKFPEKPHGKSRSSTDTMSMSEGFSSSTRNNRSTISTNSRLLDHRISRL